MANNLSKFLEGKTNSSNETTNFCSLLLLSAKGREVLLNSFTLDKVKDVLAERRQEKWGQIQ
jgi:hypothetical protein